MYRLAGYAAEVIKQIEIQDVGKTSGFTRARPVLYSAVALYVLPWATLFVLFYIAGFKKNVETVELFTGLKNDERAEPPLQVFFFLFYLFASFSFFPMGLFFKINGYPGGPVSKGEYSLIEGKKKDRSRGSPGDLTEFNLKYEVVWGILSFVSKLPLQLFFWLGAFQRERYAPVESELDDNLENTREDFSNTVMMAAIIPAATAVILGLFGLAAFADKLDLGARKLFEGVFWFILTVIGFGFAIFVPVLITANDDTTPFDGINSVSWASLLTVVALAVAQGIYDFRNSG